MRLICNMLVCSAYPMREDGRPAPQPSQVCIPKSAIASVDWNANGIDVHLTSGRAYAVNLYGHGSAELFENLIDFMKS